MTFRRSPSRTFSAGSELILKCQFILSDYGTICGILRDLFIFSQLDSHLSVEYAGISLILRVFIFKQFCSSPSQADAQIALFWTGFLLWFPLNLKQRTIHLQNDWHRPRFFILVLTSSFQFPSLGLRLLIFFSWSFIFCRLIGLTFACSTVFSWRFAAFQNFFAFLYSQFYQGLPMLFSNPLYFPLAYFVYRLIHWFNNSTTPICLLSIVKIGLERLFRQKFCFFWQKGKYLSFKDSLKYSKFSICKGGNISFHLEFINFADPLSK